MANRGHLPAQAIAPQPRQSIEQLLFRRRGPREIPRWFEPPLRRQGCGWDWAERNRPNHAFVKSKFKSAHTGELLGGEEAGGESNWRIGNEYFMRDEGKRAGFTGRSRQQRQPAGTHRAAFPAGDEEAGSKSIEAAEGWHLPANSNRAGLIPDQETGIGHADYLFESP